MKQLCFSDIKMTPSFAFKTRACYIGMPPGSDTLQLVHVDTAVKQIGALRPANGSCIPVTTRQKRGSLLMHGMDEYKVTCPKEPNREYCIALKGLHNCACGTVDEAPFLVKIPSQPDIDTGFGNDTQRRLSCRITEKPRFQHELRDTCKLDGCLTHLRCATVRARQPYKQFACSLRFGQAFCHAFLKILPEISAVGIYE